MMQQINNIINIRKMIDYTITFPNVEFNNNDDDNTHKYDSLKLSFHMKEGDKDVYIDKELSSSEFMQFIANLNNKEINFQLKTKIGLRYIKKISNTNLYVLSFKEKKYDICFDYMKIDNIHKYNQCALGFQNELCNTPFIKCTNQEWPNKCIGKCQSCMYQNKNIEKYFECNNCIYSKNNFGKFSILFPKRIYIIAINDNSNSFQLYSYIYRVEHDDILKVRLYKFPFFNIYSDGKICLGQNDNSNFIKYVINEKGINNIDDLFMHMKFNLDATINTEYAMNILKNIIKLHKKKEFDTDYWYKTPLTTLESQLNQIKRNYTY